MRTNTTGSGTGGKHGFALWEAVMAMGIAGLLALTVLSSIVFNKLQTYRDNERAMVLDYMIHYLETLRALPFSDVRAGMPINPYYDGTGSAPLIAIPSNFNWFSVNNTNYIRLHPELALLSMRNPEMRVNVATTQLAGVDNLKQIQVEFRWDAPISRGPKERVRLDLIRTVDGN